MLGKFCNNASCLGPSEIPMCTSPPVLLAGLLHYCVSACDIDVGLLIYSTACSALEAWAWLQNNTGCVGVYVCFNLDLRSEISAWSEFRLVTPAVCHHRSSQDWQRCRLVIALIKKRQSTHLGMTLLASSASAGHRFAIWAVSNCVNAGSLRRVLESDCGQKMISKNIWQRGIHSRTALAESVVLNLVNVFTYSRVLLYTLWREREISRWIKGNKYADVRGIRRIFVSVL